ncbi:helix-turn-helix transcriptional regulator [Danxiaibacter flavus]|uniref:Helix-turn-helix transcriptional regulator n=1 Tax=Danxiaibacter flavus TaxID=3049108 RepID=A0ABV3ZBY3_9BACT|nr:helix-turn-helix transcriptional regulator [Chitinophagaceae bacterium DXS]
MAEHTIHLGEKIKRFRELLGVKQDALAVELGDDWNQKKVSMLEAKADIDPAMMEKVAQALKVPRQAIENFDTERVVHICSNTINSYDHAVGISNYGTFNPLDKIIELHKEKEALHERRLKEMEALYKGC